MLQYFMACVRDLAVIHMLSLLQCEHDIVYALHAGVIAGAAAARVCIACVDDRYLIFFAFSAFPTCGRDAIRVFS